MIFIDNPRSATNFPKTNKARFVSLPCVDDNEHDVADRDAIQVVFCKRDVERNDEISSKELMNDLYR